MAGQKMDGLGWGPTQQYCVRNSHCGWEGFRGGCFILFPWTPSVKGPGLLPLCTHHWAGNNHPRVGICSTKDWLAQLPRLHQVY